jgi:putative pyruvate formate lyase activating enzyme
MCDVNKCSLCPVKCGADRDIKAGFCSVKGLKIAKYSLFAYEEPCISYKNGSGAIFFCGCSLKCVFCQNYELSRNTTGKEITASDLAEIFKKLEEAGAENINLVNPTHIIPYICDAFEIYKPKIPVVYNSHGYEKIESIKLIDKYIDIYLPDMKYFSPQISKRYTGRSNYFEYASKAIQFMANKPLIMKDGKMYSGLIVRHLVLPLCTSDSIEILKWFTTLPRSAYLSLMSQYTPFGDIEKFPELKRRITPREYKKVLDAAFMLGIENIFAQKRTSADTCFIPKWDY